MLLLVQVLPSGLAGLVAMVRNWTFTVFFCVAELWGDVSLGLLFWCVQGKRIGRQSSGGSGHATLVFCGAAQHCDHASCHGFSPHSTND